MESLEKIKYSEIAAEIMEMVERDQEMRKNFSEEKDNWDESIDANNTARMKEIVAEIGWPTVSKVGKEASHMAWLLVQHADRDIEFQKQCLELMKAEPGGEVEKRDIAYLIDRVLVHSGKPQIYGTQFREVDGKHVPEAVEDIEHLDERRAEMGMDTHAKYTKFFLDYYKFKN